MPVSADSNFDAVNGFDLLFRTPAATTDFYALDATAWSIWARRRTVRLWQAVALHTFLDPDGLGTTSVEMNVGVLIMTGVLEAIRKQTDSAERRWARNLAVACSAVAHADLIAVRCEKDPIEDSLVTLADFHQWALLSGLPVVGGW